MWTTFHYKNKKMELIRYLVRFEVLYTAAFTRLAQPMCFQILGLIDGCMHIAATKSIARNTEMMAMPAGLLMS